MITLMALLAALQAAPEPNLQIREGFERRGAVLARLDGLPGESAAACAQVCALAMNCRAWTWRAAEYIHPARCDLQSHVGPVSARPGAVTGLSAGFSAAIASAMDRPLSARERAAAREASGQPANIADDEDLEGGEREGAETPR